MVIYNLILPVILFVISIIVKLLIKVHEFDKRNPRYPYRMFESFCFGAELCIVSLGLLVGSNLLTSYAPNFLSTEYGSNELINNLSIKFSLAGKTLLAYLLGNVVILLIIIFLRVLFSKECYFEYEKVKTQPFPIFKISFIKTLKKQKFYLCLILVDVLGLASVASYFLYLDRVKNVLFP